MKKIWLLLAIMLMAFALVATGCGAEDSADNGETGNNEEGNTAADTSWDDIVAKGYFILGLDDAFPPMGFRDENNEIVGFDIDLASAVAEYYGIEVKLQPVDWSTVEMSLNTNEIDCIWNGLSITEDRAKVMDFTDPYVASTQIIVTKADSDINTKADLAGKIVGTQMASSSISALETEPEVMDSFGELKEYDTFVNAMMDLDNDRVDAVVIDSIVFYGDFNVKNPTAYKALEENFGEELYAIGVRQADDTFTDKLNEAIKALKESGKAAEISEKWFGEDILL